MKIIINIKPTKIVVSGFLDFSNNPIASNKDQLVSRINQGYSNVHSKNYSGLVNRNNTHVRVFNLEKHRKTTEMVKTTKKIGKHTVLSEKRKVVTPGHWVAYV